MATITFVSGQTITICKMKDSTYWFNVLYDGCGIPICMTDAQLREIRDAINTLLNEEEPIR